MAVVVMAFVITMIFVVAAKTVRIRYAAVALSNPFRKTVRLAVLFLFFASSLALILVGGVLSSYQSGRIGFGSGILAELSNLSVSLARSAGLLVAIVPIGAVAVYEFRAKTFKEPFLLITLLLLVPTLSLRQYTGFYIVPFTAIFIGIGLWSILHELRRMETKVAVLVVASVLTLLSAEFALGIDLQTDPALRNASYTNGVYIMHTTDGTIIANDGRTASEIFAVSGRAYLPVGGATTPFQSPELLIFGFVDPSELTIVPVPLNRLTVESDSPFSLLDVNSERDWAEILNSPVGSVPTRIWQTYDPSYLVESWDARGGYLAYGNRYDSPFVRSAHLGSYKVFEIQRQTLWFVDGIAG